MGLNHFYVLSDDGNVWYHDGFRFRSNYGPLPEFIAECQSGRLRARLEPGEGAKP
jgi:hypothetical protein